MPLIQRIPSSTSTSSSGGTDSTTQEESGTQIEAYHTRQLAHQQASVSSLQDIRSHLNVYAEKRLGQMDTITSIMADGAEQVKDSLAVLRQRQIDRQEILSRSSAARWQNVSEFMRQGRQSWSDCNDAMAGVLMDNDLSSEERQQRLGEAVDRSSRSLQISKVEFCENSSAIEQTVSEGFSSLAQSIASWEQDVSSFKRMCLELLQIQDSCLKTTNKAAAHMMRIKFDQINETLNLVVKERQHRLDCARAENDERRRDEKLTHEECQREHTRKQEVRSFQHSCHVAEAKQQAENTAKSRAADLADRRVEIEAKMQELRHELESKKLDKERGPVLFRFARWILG